MRLDENVQATYLARLDGGFLVGGYDEQAQEMTATYYADDGSGGMSWPTASGFAVSGDGRTGAFVQPDGTVIAVGRKGWTDFARAPGSSGPTPEAVAGRSLFEMIADPEAKRAFEAIHRRVATLATSALTYEYRCDAPDLERLMKMSVSALISEGRLFGVLYQSTLLSAKERVPLPFLSRREV